MKEKVFELDQGGLPLIIIGEWTYLYDYPAQIANLEVKAPEEAALEIIYNK